MADTRESLTEKVSLLEQHVVGKLQSATEAVEETVHTVKSAVEDTVAAVTGSVKNSIEGMTEALDMRKRVQETPWLMVGCDYGRPRDRADCVPRAAEVGGRHVNVHTDTGGCIHPAKGGAAPPHLAGWAVRFGRATAQEVGGGSPFNGGHLAPRDRVGPAAEIN